MLDATAPKKKKKDSTFDPSKVLPDLRSEIPLRPARDPPKETIYDAFPPFIILLPFHILFKKIFGRSTDRNDITRDLFGKKKEAPPIDSNIPLESEFSSCFNPSFFL